jgi:hypothetical protein
MIKITGIHYSERQKLRKIDFEFKFFRFKLATINIKGFDVLENIS